MVLANCNIVGAGCIFPRVLIALQPAKTHREGGVELANK